MSVSVSTLKPRIACKMRQSVAKDFKSSLMSLSLHIYKIKVTSDSLISLARSLMSWEGFMFSGSSSSCSRRACYEQKQAELR